ncbi:sugar phosphate isomerase/epimerase family protein [Tsukamurella ocularis]|uniref:sugar phosphate isomerase/epimerase family protein n=1 Tax=Tsukamurella ocularis TaxID=1970234 RepID=UPI00216945F0|nr:sugar phosphate isomerase/epimerase [Tsukamurella ocularis]MCS3781954.1 inosose dehydratase [Tsukamurella ocularis]MCS3788448.1 inosose dehydratase [Tsukamurella ocularis]MCS3852168.1 inosose dehydratase [Tsukamurella ocularis]
MTDTLGTTASTAPHTAGLRIGTAPDSWGVWFADHPRQTPWDRFLDEVAEAGYHYIELGPYGYLPTDPERLKDELAKRDLELSGGTIFTGFHKGADQWDRAWKQVSDVATLVGALGAEHIVVIPDLWRSDLTGEALESRTLNDEQWKALAAGHDRLGKALAEEYGIKQQFHSHADSHVGTTGEVERLLAETDPRYVNLCLDTGHFAYYGGDNVALMQRHPERIGYLHLKQIDPALIWEVLKNDTPFADAASAIMVEPPNGIPDFAPVIEAALRINPDLFAIVEQDMPGCDIAVPAGIATRTRQHIFGCHPLTRTR